MAQLEFGLANSHSDMSDTRQDFFVDFLIYEHFRSLSLSFDFRLNTAGILVWSEVVLLSILSDIGIGFVATGIFLLSALDLIVVIEVAILAFSFRIDKSVSVRALVRIAFTAIFVVTVIAHALRVVLLV